MKFLIIILALVVLLVNGCSQSQIGIIKIEVNCSEVDCSCNINDACDKACDVFEIKNDQDWDRVVFEDKPYCVCS